MIEVDKEARTVPARPVVPEPAGTDAVSLAAVAYAAFFTETEREEIGAFDDLPAPERARWHSVAAHVAQTVVSPVDEDIERWRTEQREDLAQQVRDAPYTRDVWRATLRTTNLQQHVGTLQSLLRQSQESAARTRSQSQRLATTTQAMRVALGPDASRRIGLIDRAQRPTDIDPTGWIPPDISGVTDRPFDPHELMVRSA